MSGRHSTLTESVLDTLVSNMRPVVCQRLLNMDLIVHFYSYVQISVVSSKLLRHNQFVLQHAWMFHFGLIALLNREYRYCLMLVETRTQPKHNHLLRFHCIFLLIALLSLPNAGEADAQSPMFPI